MPRRQYNLGRRAEAAEETRQRIIEATQALHATQGIAATTMKQIAERAGVSTGTVHHHFPSYADAIRACSEETLRAAPPPTGERLFADAKAMRERVARLAAACFEWYEAVPAFHHVRADCSRVPALRGFVEAEERNRIALMREALAPCRVDARDARVAAALLDLSVFRSLRESGFSRAECVSKIADVIVAWLGNGEFD